MSDDLVKDLEDYAGFPLIGRGTRGRLIQKTMRAAARRIRALTDERPVIFEHTFATAGTYRIEVHAYVRPATLMVHRVERTDRAQNS